MNSLLLKTKLLVNKIVRDAVMPDHYIDDYTKGCLQQDFTIMEDSMQHAQKKLESLSILLSSYHMLEERGDVLEIIRDVKRTASKIRCARTHL